MNRYRGGLARLQLRRDPDVEKRDDGERHDIERDENGPDVLLDAVLHGHVANADAVEVGAERGLHVDVLDVDGEWEDCAHRGYPHRYHTQASRQPGLERVEDEAIPAQ